MNDMIIGQNGASGVPAAELIKDTDTKGFMADVIEVSKKVPVLDAPAATDPNAVEPGASPREPRSP